MQEVAFWRAAPVLLLAHLLQTTWLARWEFWGTKVDLPLLVAVAVALSGGVQRGAWTGFFAGLLTGLPASAYLGSFLVSRTVAGALMGFVPRGMTADNPLAPPVCAMGATIIADLVFMVMSPTIYPFVWWLKHAAVQTVMHSVLIWPIFYLIHRLVLPQTRPVYL